LKKTNIKILLIIGIVFIVIFNLFKERKENFENDYFLDTYNDVELDKNISISKKITIYIAGEVKKPRCIYS